MSGKFYWRRLHEDIERAMHARLRSQIDDAIARVTAAGERRRERERLAREQASAERILHDLESRVVYVDFHRPAARSSSSTSSAAIPVSE